MFTLFLERIQPCFPRFLSEFKSATYIDLAESLVGLFQNSKTIRTLMSGKFRDEVDAAILKSKMCALESLIEIIPKSSGNSDWPPV